MDWLLNVEDGLALLGSTCQRWVLIGLSMGGMIVLAAVTRYQVQAVVTRSIAFGIPSDKRTHSWREKLVHQMIMKQMERFPKEHPLYHRRELDYPAYPEFTLSILGELEKPGAAMEASLPDIRVLVLLIPGVDEQSVLFNCLHNIYDRLGSAQKEMLALEGIDHSLVRDPRRQVVFDKVGSF